MSKPRAKGDWRNAPSVEGVPPPPRAPSARALHLIHGYRGTQRIKLWIGVGFLIIGGILAPVFGGGSLGDVALALFGRETTGTITSSFVRTDVEIMNKHPYSIHFEVELDGRLKVASSTTTSDALGELPVGTRAPVEYVPWKPEWVRLRGATYSTFSAWGLLTFVFPFAGLALTVFTVLGNRREIRAHRVGVPIVAQVTFRGPDTTASSNGEHPHMITWEFAVDGKSYQGKLSSQQEQELQDLGDAKQIVVLYDPRDPSINTAYVA